jgi:hypothetical protein
MAATQSALGTYLAHSELRLLYSELKTICITNVLTETPLELRDYNEIEFMTTNCSTHSQEIFSAILALQRTRELPTSPIQIPGISSGSSLRIVRRTPPNLGAASQHTTPPTENDRLLDIILHGKVYYLQADWIPFPPNGHQTESQLCSHATIIEDGPCSNQFELAKIRLTRNFEHNTSTIGTVLTPALSLTVEPTEGANCYATFLEIRSNEANPSN